LSRITIDGTFNVRKAGTAEASSSVGVMEEAPAWLVRSATLDALSPAGSAALADLGISLVVDLREAGERAEIAHAVPVLHNPIYSLPDGPPVTGTLEDIYETLLLTRGGALTSAVMAIADAPGPVLVHCTAGKDRTGLVVALALLAAGVPREAVVADYVASAESVRENRQLTAETLLAALELDGPTHTAALRLHLDSPAVALEHAIDILDGLGGAEQYLTRHGLTAQQLSTLTSRLGGVV
jgi:hypothetical protein